MEALLDLVESLLERGFAEGGALVHVSLPTGYGKSEASLRLAELIAELGEESPAERLIHVVPTKYLVEDLANRARRRGLPALAQSMFINPSLKAPYFIQPLIFTTLDSYSMNYYKVPVAEVRSISAGKSLGHSEVPRYSILTAINVFDEYHMFVPGDSPSEDPRFEAKAWTVLSSIVPELISFGAPVLLETATPRPEALNLIRNRLPPRRSRVYEVVYDYSGVLKETEGRRVVSDREFADTALRREIVTKVIEGSLSREAERVVSSSGDDFVLVVSNTVREAVGTYRLLKDKIEQVVLLHSRLTVGDRARRIREIEERLRKRKPLTLVSTQVIEVGVNLDFRTMVSAAAPISSLVQRIGRVGRGVYMEEGPFEVHIVYDPTRGEKALYDGVYSANAVRLTISELRSIEEGGKEVSWKIPSSEDLSINGKRLVPYNRIAERVYASLEVGVDDELRGLLNSLSRPYVRSEKAMEWMIRLGGFVRDSVILPVYVPREDEIPSSSSSLDELRIERIVPVKAGALGVTFLLGTRPKVDVKWDLLRKVVICRDNRVMAILSGPRDELRYELTSLSELEELLVRMHCYREGRRLASLEALVARPESYDPEVGLLI